MDFLSKVSVGLAIVTFNSAFSYCFKISKPKAVLIHSIGWTLTATAALSAPFASNHGVYLTSTFIAANLVGQQLANRACKIEVANLDVLKLQAAAAACLISAGIVMALSNSEPADLIHEVIKKYNSLCSANYTTLLIALN